MPGIVVPIGVEAAAGRARTSAAIAGGVNVAQEIGPEGIRGAAKGTAQEIAKLLRDAFQKQGWI